MQYAVPQFTDVEDKLIGPLTLKQFLFILATGGIEFFYYSLLHISIFFFFFALPTAIIGLMLTFGKYNNRPLYGYLVPFISFAVKPRVRVFIREEPDMIVSVKQDKPQKKKTNIESDEPAESRLKKLAYLLDQQTEDEKSLINERNSKIKSPMADFKLSGNDRTQNI